MKFLVTTSAEPVQASPPATPVLSYTQLNNPLRTEVRDHAGAWLATFTHGARTVVLRGQERLFTQQDLPILDVFSRVRSGSGWGQATFGGIWHQSGGTEPDDYSVTGNEGTITVTSENVSRRLTVNNNDIRDVDATAKFKTDKTARGSAQVAGLLFGYRDTDNHYLAQLSFIPALVTDTFSRIEANGWGVANSDQTWSTSGGSSNEYTTNGNEGVHSVGSVNVSRRTVLASAQATDFDIRVRVKTDVLASGASVGAAILGRYTDSNNHYIFRLRFGSTAAHQVFAAIQKQENGIVSTLGSETTTGLTHVTGAYFWIRAQATGTTLRMRTWLDGAAEPSTWDVSLSDTTFTGSGAIGVRSILTTGNSNTLPFAFTYDDFEASLNGATTDSVEVRLRKRVAGTYSSISPAFTLSASHAANEYFYLRATLHSGVLQARAWKDGTAEPSTWQVSASDTTYTSGKVGVRAICNIGTTNLPVTFSWDDFYAEGAWVNPPVVQHGTWVRILPAPFQGTVDEAWLVAQLYSAAPDILAVAMQYVTHAPSVLAGSLRTAGDSQYGPLQADGTRQEGSDFNDYLGIPWQYGTFTDQPETAQAGCMDCSGFLRMVFGYRGGVTLTSSVINGISIPRVSSNIANNGPGIVVIPNTGTQPTDFSALQPGDVVCFDADTTNPDEEEGQIDHNGIYLGVDTSGNHRFISSRKTVNGPSLSDTGGPSILNGSSLYGRSFRLVRRF